MYGRVLLIVVTSLVLVLAGGCPVIDIPQINPANRVPLADAGPDVDRCVGDTITLNASGSADADGDTLTYQWTQAGGRAVGLRGAVSASPSFTASAAGVFEFSVTITDGQGGSDDDSVRVVVNSCDPNSTPDPNSTVDPQNRVPSADAGPDIDACVGDTITLRATRSLDSDGDALTYKWTQTSGGTARLGGAMGATPSFTVTEPGTFEFSVRVSDSRGGADDDSVRVVVQTCSAEGMVAYTNEDAWYEAAGSALQFPLDPRHVGLADEAGAPPSRAACLPQSLTFPRQATGLSVDFKLRTLQPGYGWWQWDEAYQALSVGCSGSFDHDDWEVVLTNTPQGAVHAFAMEVVDSDAYAGETLSVYGPGDILLGAVPIPAERSFFLGVVSPEPIVRVVHDEDAGADNVDLIALHFGAVRSGGEEPSPQSDCDQLWREACDLLRESGPTTTTNGDLTSRCRAIRKTLEAIDAGCADYLYTPDELATLISVYEAFVEESCP